MDINRPLEPKERTAVVRATSEPVIVYKHALSTQWVRSDDCTTGYDPNELEFTNNK